MSVTTTAPPITPSSPSANKQRPTACELLEAVVPVIDVPAFFGPPVIFLLGPWLLLVLLLIPPAALLITLALVAVVVAGALAALAAIVASPFLVVRHLRTRHAADGRRFGFGRSTATPVVSTSSPQASFASAPSGQQVAAAS
jgi:hypothetical protein